MSGPALLVSQGDITDQDADAIVNAANAALKCGSGVDGAIHRAAGPELQSALDVFAGCPTGDCRATPGFRLKARHIIHCVGPVWRGGGAGEAALLASCYRRAVALAVRLGCRSLAFPAISTGIYGFPAERAADIAVDTVRKELAQGGPDGVPSLGEVRFVCFDTRTAELYRALLP